MDVQAALKAIADDAARGDMVFTSNADLASRVRRALDDTDCSIDQLSKLVSAEPILAARVVGIANSAAYNHSGRPITDINRAISLIGFSNLRALATAVVVRQMEGMSQTPEHRALARKLWEHTAHVAALARLIAKRVTHQNPDAAFFAGIVHEVGGFYLISRAAEFPGLLEGDFEAWYGRGEAKVGRAVLAMLGAPENILAAMEILWAGYLSMPPESLGDTLLLAEQLSPVESPLSQLAGMGRRGMPVEIDVVLDDETLSGILRDSAEEVESLTKALQA